MTPTDAQARAAQVMATLGGLALCGCEGQADECRVRDAIAAALLQAAQEQREAGAKIAEQECDDTVAKAIAQAIRRAG